ncbi:putative ZNF706/superfamily, at2g23090-like, zinc-binding domain-containing protein [Helianthus anomalus]
MCLISWLVFCLIFSFFFAGSQLEANKKAMNIQCKVCMQTFICTTSEVKCREHAEAKHPKADVYTCFPHLKK